MRHPLKVLAESPIVAKLEPAFGATRLAPQGGMYQLRYDASSTAWFLTNTVTFETLCPINPPLNHAWGLELDEDGFAFLADTGDTEHHWVSDFPWRYQVHIENRSIQMFVHDSKNDRSTLLNNFFGTFRETTLLGKFFSHSVDETVRLGIYDIPQDGCRVFVCALDLYRLLGLKTCKGLPSKWVHKQVPVWMRLQHRLDLSPCHVRKSMPYRSQDLRLNINCE